MYGRHRNVINVKEEEGGVWTLEQEDARVVEQIMKYKKFSGYMFLAIAAIMLLFYFFGCYLYISEEAWELVRVVFTEEVHWRYTLSMFLFICMMQFCIYYCIAYQMREWDEGKHTDHMLAVYYCSALEIIFTLAYLISYIRIIR